MSDLRTAAQAVIDSYDVDVGSREAYYKHLHAQIEALRQAIAEPVEPVGKKLTREELGHTDGRIEFVWWKDIPHGAFIYTTPPSVAVEPVCNPHPDAPHGFNRNASHTEDRYVCDCESWEPPSVDALTAEAVAKEREACAKLCEYLDARWGIDSFLICAEAIRARGQK